MARLEVVNFLGTFPTTGNTFTYPSDIPEKHSVVLVYVESIGAEGISDSTGNGPWNFAGACGFGDAGSASLAGRIAWVNVTSPISAGGGFNASPMSAGLVYELNNTIDQVIGPSSDVDHSANFGPAAVHDSFGINTNPDLIFALEIAQDYNSNGLTGAVPSITGGGAIVSGTVTQAWTNVRTAGPKKGQTFSYTNDDYGLATGYIVNPGTDTFSITGTAAGDQNSCTVIGFIGTNRWSNPANLEASDGSYHTVYAKNDGNIYHKRYPFTRPHSDGVESAVTDAASDGLTDTEPRIADELNLAVGGRRLWVVFSRSGDVYSTYSDDNGATWSTPTLTLMASKHPIVRVDRVTGAVYIAAMVAGTPNTIQATIQYPGDTSPSSPFTLTDSASANISIDDDYFEVAPSGDSSSRWMLVTISGAAVKNYYSTDNGHTWTLVT